MPAWLGYGSGVKRDGGQQLVNFAGVRGATADGGDLDGEHEANGLAVARRTGVPDGFFDVRLDVEQPVPWPNEIVLRFPDQAAPARASGILRRARGRRCDVPRIKPRPGRMSGERLLAASRAWR